MRKLSSAAGMETGIIWIVIWCFATLCFFYICLWVYTNVTLEPCERFTDIWHNENSNANVIDLLAVSFALTFLLALIDLYAAFVNDHADKEISIVLFVCLLVFALFVNRLLYTHNAYMALERGEITLAETPALKSNFTLPRRSALLEQLWQSDPTNYTCNLHIQKAQIFYNEFLGLKETIDRSWLKNHYHGSRADFSKTTWSKPKGMYSFPTVLSVRVANLDVTLEKFGKQNELGFYRAPRVHSDEQGVREIFLHDPLGYPIHIWEKTR